MKSTWKILLVVCFFVSFSNLTYSRSYKSYECKKIWKKILSEHDLEDPYDELIGLCGSSFRRKLREIISTNDPLSYRRAREIMFSDLFNFNGRVCSVYTNKCIYTEGIPNPYIMNCEHSWPQSKGATGIAKSDLHHLYPAMMRINSKRLNHPLCEVKEVRWEGGGSATGTNKWGTYCFEPRDAHKGDAARAMLYFAVRYNKRIDYEQEYFFKKWNKRDRVSKWEMIRNHKIEDYQENRNPFIDYPEFVDLIADF